MHYGSESSGRLSKKGLKGGPGLEEGGVIIDGVAHGLCAGFPNPAEIELLDPCGGGDVIAYGVVGYPGAAKVDIYASTAGTFDAGKLVGSTTSLVADSYAAEHDLGFATSHSSTGQLVSISDSQGIWELPRNTFRTTTRGLIPRVLHQQSMLDGPNTWLSM